MAKIDIYTSDVSASVGRLKSVVGTIEEARSITSRVCSGLDFQVKARADIETKLDKVKKNLKADGDRVQDLAKLADTAVAEFQRADGKSMKQSDRFLGKIRQGIANVLHQVKDLFVNTHIGRHTAITGLFLKKAPLVSAPVSVLALNTTLRNVLHKGGIAAVGEEEVVRGGALGDLILGNFVPQSPYTGCKSYDASLYAGKADGDYSGYSIVAGMSPDFLLKQTGKKCTVCSYWMLAAAYSGKIPTNSKTGEELTPDSMWIDGVGAVNDKDSRNPATIWSNRDYTAPEQYLEDIYNNLSVGIPIGARAVSKTGSSGHTVACVGLKDGVDFNSFKNSLAALDKSSPDYQSQYKKLIKDFQNNILIADPATGRIGTLANYDLSMGKALWYPDGAPVVM